MMNRGQGWRENTAGIYHTAGIGAVNRFDWAEKILALDPLPQEHRYTSLFEASSADFDTPAQRPLFTALDCTLFQKTFLGFTISWEEALAKALSV
jgi:dTDP-4-dehydrorhamnose reductase